MDSKEFKNIFNEVAKRNNFEKAFGGWFIESPECIVVLDLQKSNFGDYYELNIKIFVQGMFGNAYVKGKDLVKKEIGDTFTRQPDNYKDVFDFDISMDDDKRKQKLEELFSAFIKPFANKALSRKGLKELGDQEKIFLLPAVKAELA
ncbi:MAG: DUF4304 domain-containing protein [Paludibacter sp.]